MSERSERVIESARSGQWCTVNDVTVADTERVHQ